MGPINTEWLTLEQASNLLGVHATTLRRWANHGAIDFFLTAGGHRRFRRADVERFADEHRRTRIPAQPARSWEVRTLARTRQGLPKQPWLAGFDEAERQVARQLGRRLIGLTLQYVVQSGNGEEALLAEARTIARLHAESGLQHGRSLVDLLAIVSFFRATILEVAILQMPRITASDPDASLRLVHRLEAMVGEIQAAVVEYYLSGGRT